MKRPQRVVPSYRLLDFVFYLWLGVTAPRVITIAPTDQAASQGRIRSQIQTLLFHLPFSVLVESLKQVFDRRAFLDYGFQLRDRRVQLIFLDNAVR